MSTEGAVGFVQSNNMTIIYNGYDSYPESLGNSILDFIRRWGIDRVEDMVSNFVYVNDGSEGTGFYDFDSYFQDERGRASRVVHVHKELPIQNDINFVYNSLFCEWLYLVDLDEGNLEVYRGFNKDKPNGRFHDVPPSENGYRAVTLVMTIPLNNLPPKFYNEEFK